MLADVYLPLLNLVDMVQTIPRHLNIVFVGERLGRTWQQVGQVCILIDLRADEVFIGAIRVRVLNTLHLAVL